MADNKVEVIMLKTVTVRGKRYPMWTHQVFDKERADKYVAAGDAKIVKQ